jgi:hypothetical protein
MGNKYRYKDLIIRKGWECGNSVSSDHQRKHDSGEFIPLEIFNYAIIKKLT